LDILRIWLLTILIEVVILIEARDDFWSERWILNLFTLSLALYFFSIGWIIRSKVRIENILVEFIEPIILLLPWVIIIFSNYMIFLRAIWFFKRKMKVLSVMYHVFYFVISAIILYTLIIPALSPLLVISLAAYIPYIVVEKMKKISRNRVIGALIFVVLMAVCIYFFIIILAPFYFIFTRHSIELTLCILSLSIEEIYGIAICIGASAGLGDFILLVYEGAAQYDPSTKIPYGKILIIQGILSGIFILLYVSNGSYMSIIGSLMTISILTWIIRKYKGLSEIDTNIDYYSALIFLVFGLVNFLTSLKRYKLVDVPFLDMYNVLVLVLVATMLYLGTLLFSFFEALKGEDIET